MLHVLLNLNKSTPLTCTLRKHIFIKLMMINIFSKSFSLNRNTWRKRFGFFFSKYVNVLNVKFLDDLLSFSEYLCTDNQKQHQLRKTLETKIGLIKHSIPSTQLTRSYKKSKSISRSI